MLDQYNLVYSKRQRYLRESTCTQRSSLDSESHDLPNSVENFFGQQSLLCESSRLERGHLSHQADVLVDKSVCLDTYPSIDRNQDAILADFHTTRPA